MEISADESNRIKQRYDVNLKAEVSLTGKDAHEHQCRIKNLSPSGACLHFESTVAVKVGMSISIKTFIPGTIMHLPNSGEIMWFKEQNNGTAVGLKFQDILSEIMMKKLVQDGAPASPHKP